MNASHHLLGQLLNVLDLSRVEAKAVEIVPKSTELRPLAEQLLETARATNHRLGKSIELSLEIAADTPKLFTLDARRVTQILNNLTENALKFTSNGKVCLAMRPATSTDPGAPEELEISESDTGFGIPRSKSEAVFERFVQIDSAPTREQGGSGLGLAIRRELAELMGGSLSVACPSPHACSKTKFTLRLCEVE